MRPGEAGDPENLLSCSAQLKTSRVRRRSAQKSAGSQDGVCVLSRPQLAPYQYLERLFCKGLWQTPFLPPWPGIGMSEAITTMKVCGRVVPGCHFRGSSWDTSPLAYTSNCEFLASGARLELRVGSVRENNSTSECQRMALL